MYCIRGSTLRSNQSPPNLSLDSASMESHLLVDEDDKPENTPLITNLPRKNGYSLSPLYQFHGSWYTEEFLRGIISAQANFHPRPSDIVLASFPKTGTTWLKALCIAIATRRRFDDSTSPLLSRLPHDCIPLLEVDLAAVSEFSGSMALPFVSTHGPFESLPGSVMATPGCKVVYIWRDPKDAFVSMWYFVSKIMVSKGHNPLPMEEAFEFYCQGLLVFGPYWDHVVGYLKASMEKPDRILVLKYEDLTTDTVRHVKKLADFIGYPFTSEEVGDGVAEKIVSFCSMKKLSGLEVNKAGKHHFGDIYSIDNNVYFRKGEVGDWRNHLTEEMGARLDNIMSDKFQTAGLKVGG